jgi:hypothetical protein
MRYYLVAVACCVLMSGGCTRIVFGESVKVAAQSNADLDAAAWYIEEHAIEAEDYPVAMAARAVRGHGENMAKAMYIDKEDLPSPRVGKNDWKVDPDAAYEKSNAHIKEDLFTVTNVAGAGLAALSVLAIGARLGQAILKTHPVLGPLLGGIGTLFGYSSPVKDAVHEKLIAALEEYRLADPAWESNPIFKLLSSKLTNAEKDYIKVKRNAV